MIRREGDLAGEWDRMRLVERQKMISGERGIEPLFHEKSAALKIKWRELARGSHLAVHDAIKYPTQTRKHRNESPVFESPERPNLSTRKHDLTILLESRLAKSTRKHALENRR